ncbi:MAG: citramalate synthase, partial [Alphaproteobacteria bacterium]|nr:citramalate synthase [Alphaproteobacteria bacterium]
PVYGCLADFKLKDYKVRIFDGDKGTGSTTRVLVDAVDSQGHRWSTVGFSGDVIDASFQALQDSILYKLMISQI